MGKTPKAENAPQDTSRGGKETKKKRVTLFDKIKWQINAVRLIFSVLFMLLYTAFTVIMLMQKWGSTVYLSIILGFIGLYILLFAVLLILQSRSRLKFDNSLKNYKSGLKIIKSLLVLINFGLTVSVFIQAAGARDMGTPFQIAILVITLTWAIFQIVFQIDRIIKRQKALKKKAKKSKSVPKEKSE